MIVGLKRWPLRGQAKIFENDYYGEFKQIL